ncbi:hypothetical protein EDD11_007329 [Mortierella claussenii]|nr:hypothetical protein EDD11_007329 [Mortierella claussenii]
MVVTQVSPGGPDSTAVTYQPQQPAMGYVQQQPPQPLQPTPIYNTPPPLIGGHDPNYVQQVQFPGTYVTPGQEYQPVPTNVAPSPYMGSPYPVTVADPYQQPQRQPSPVAGYSEPYTPSQQYVQDQPTEFAGYHQQQPPGPLATPQPLYEQAPASIQTPYAYSPHSPQQFGHATYVPK